MISRPSLTTRLAGLYGLSTACLLVLVSFMLNHFLTNALEQKDRQQLEEKLRNIEAILQEQDGNQHMLAQEVLQESTDTLMTRILNAEGATLLSSPWLEKFLPADMFKPGFATLHLNDRTFRLADTGVIRIQKKAWRLQAALDVSDDAAMLHRYRHYLWLCVGGGSLLAVILGYSVAHRGLRPLKAIARAAEEISATRLHARLGGAAWPADLAVLARSFDAMLTRLEEAFDRLSRFSADLAHELRTPLNNLMGEAEVALARTRTPEEYQQVLSSSLEEYDRLARMLDSLLFLARAEHAQMAVRQERVDARAMLNALRQYQSVLAEEKSIRLICEGEGMLTADPELCRRAVNNLISNALRHTPVGGRVVLGVYPQVRGVEIRVADNGDGISAIHLDRLGERFYRANTRNGGSGLGLAIVRSIMELHGGRLIINSSPNQGTVAALWFPS